MEQEDKNHSSFTFVFPLFHIYSTLLKIKNKDYKDLMEKLELDFYY